MEAEHIEVAGFVKQFQPFSGLPQETINSIAQQVEIAYYRADSNIFNFGDEVHDLCMIRSGSVEVYRRNGDLYNRLSAGGLFGQMGFLMNNRIRLPVKALEDSLIYFIPESVFIALCDEFEAFAYFVEMDDHSNLQHAASDKNANSLMVSKVTKLISRAPITIENTATIRQAAEKMTKEGVSSLLIVNAISPLAFESHETRAEQQMVGIVTDRDLRTRVVSTGFHLDATIDQVMSTDLVTLDVGAYAFEAMLSMLRYNLHHLPVLDKGCPVGVIAISDIVRYESQSSLYMVGTVFRQHNIEELKHISEQISSCFVRLVNEDANSHMIGSAMSVIGRSFKQRLLELAEVHLGPPPLPYCFLALGSMARDEQLIITDQDNALILDNQYDPQLHAHYRYIEREFLHAALKVRLGEGICFPVVDTMDLEACLHRKGVKAFVCRLFGRKPLSIRLSDSRARYNLPFYKQHEALTDAVATAELLQAQIAYHYSPDTPIAELWR